jgi:hypothetical protein
MENRIFVFGSNRRGWHGGGAARFAHECRGAEWYVGEGLTGQSYALPTVETPGQPLPLDDVKGHVEKFKDFVRANPDMRFQVTPVGCGLAGFKHSQIAPMFADAPDNCDLPDEFRQVLDKQ